MVTASSNEGALLQLIALDIALANGNTTGGSDLCFTSGDITKGEDVGSGTAGAFLARGGHAATSGTGGDASLVHGTSGSGLSSYGTVNVGSGALTPSGISGTEVPGSVLVRAVDDGSIGGGVVWVTRGGGDPLSFGAPQAGSVIATGGPGAGTEAGGFVYLAGGLTPSGAPTSALGGVENAIYITGGGANNDDDAGRIEVTGGASGGAAGDGGLLALAGGNVVPVTNLTGVGGAVSITGGANLSGNGLLGGAVSITGGAPGGETLVRGGETAGTIAAGNAILEGGQATSSSTVAKAGDAIVQGGVADGTGVDGGDVQLLGRTPAGAGSADGGSIIVAVGSGILGGVDGTVDITGDTAITGDTSVVGAFSATSTSTDGVRVNESAASPIAFGSGFGVVWVSSGFAPNRLFYTDEGGTDIPVSAITASADPNSPVVSAGEADVFRDTTGGAGRLFVKRTAGATASWEEAHTYVSPTSSGTIAPDGRIIKWGITPIPAGGVTTVLVGFPTPFASATPYVIEVSLVWTGPGSPPSFPVPIVLGPSIGAGGFVVELSVASPSAPPSFDLHWRVSQ